MIHLPVLAALKLCDDEVAAELEERDSSPVDVDEGDD